MHNNEEVFCYLSGWNCTKGEPLSTKKGDV